jgi:uncharacterized ubiquitin-like protein YukD
MVIFVGCWGMAIIAGFFQVCFDYSNYNYNYFEVMKVCFYENFTLRCKRNKNAIAFQDANVLNLLKLPDCYQVKNLLKSVITVDNLDISVI